MKKIILPKFTKYEKLLANNFGEECYQTNKEEYAKRNQDDITKVIADITYGKLSEILLQKYFKENKVTSTGVDFLVYPKNLKSFDADLYTFPSADKVNNIHVKSCNSNSKFKTSWLFQPNDVLTLLPKPNDYIALVVLYTHPMNNSYCYFVNANNVLSLYRDPEKDSLNKKVIYEEDLKIS
jgi:hypothetical protein